MASYGWCWVPPTVSTIYWSPGYVGWIVTPTYVAWVPLAPGEIYYGYGYYGPWSRNITTININTSVGNRTYINLRVNNAVVTVQRDSFGTGRRIQLNLKENPFDQFKRRMPGDTAIFPPQIKPKQPIVVVPNSEKEQMRNRLIERERMSRERQQYRPIQPTRPEKPDNLIAVPPSAVERPVRPQVKPPERFRKIRPEEMKNERRVVKERESSVFRPQQPENLPVKKSKTPRAIIRKQVPQLKQNKADDGRERHQERER
jgi:hypothetical protein